MSSQGPTGAHEIRGIQGDASNWTQLLKRQKTYTGLQGNVSDVASNLLQSNQLRIDYNLGMAGCTGPLPYPRLPTGATGPC
jgi:hypothetical protein